ncbi:3-phosphoshikimate 1-carboxyvinyltransferase [bacterium]|jgi:3-phosphoshikimate 1-carboxyvinyltransferase|nr:3-phosphoshikimate 1-carboxyvinyltransferase [bacterium]
MNCQILPNGVNKDKEIAISDIPGDKSLSHRAAIFGALAKGTSTFTNFLFSEDCLNTVSILKSLGVTFELNREESKLIVHGVGLDGLKPYDGVLDVGNSGTGIRLLSGVLGCQTFQSKISGDASIQKRPMKRIADPLFEMGIIIDGEKRNNNLFPPLVTGPIYRDNGGQPVTYTLPVASAQVKSAVLLAALYFKNETTVIEPEKCRDHTERFLSYYGADFKQIGTRLICSGKHELNVPNEPCIYLPSDVSSAAFFIVLGLKSTQKMILPGIGINPTRDAVIHALIDMGAQIQINKASDDDLESYADLTIYPSKLTNIDLKKETIPFLIDEIPILAIAAMNGTGRFTVRGAEELRVKESDRISTIVEMVRAMGGNIEEFDDGFQIDGNLTQFRSFEVDSHGDHRIAMSAIIGAYIGNVSAVIKNCECINTSFPNFFEILERIFPSSFVIQ